MYKINLLNPIADCGVNVLDKNVCIIDADIKEADSLVLRSAPIHDMQFEDKLLVVGRAGAGTNNIPIDTLTQRGVPVLNTPGANANAVKELIVTGMLLASRNIFAAHRYLSELEGDYVALHKAVEANKKMFVGTELKGKVLGVIGLGAIGVQVANVARDLGMQVIGFDPHISVQNAWRLCSSVAQAETAEEVLAKADFLTCHIPLIDDTRHWLNASRIAQLKKGAVILNFSRSEIVDAQAVLEAIEHEHLRYYVSDFPSTLLCNQERVLTLPHLGASTVEAQDNCAVMIFEQVQDYLLKGHIKNSVNFPNVTLSSSGFDRIAIVNHNVPNMVAQMSAVVAQHQLNIIDMINKSREAIAYTLMDVEQKVTDSVIADLSSIEGVIRLRLL